ncbi:MAG: response regulator [Desulfobaccales bacterium]
MAGIHILLVDDDQLICSLGRELLEKMGYKVETAGLGEEVFEKLRRDSPLDLVILDNNLPDMSGLEVMQRLRKTHPGAKVLVASGFFSKRETEELRACGAAGVLNKPFRLGAVKSMIDEVLGEDSKG